ncbi:MAG: dodecin domain-containing protein [Armatimonadetes bacterium]|nr:dodecin domain-containing protein [Armatimonadota bacterium]
MMGATYKIIELFGTSQTSYEDAIGSAVTEASKTLHDLKWFEVAELRGGIENGKVTEYQAKVKIAFKIKK